MKSNLDKKLVGSLSLADVIHFVIAVIIGFISIPMT